MVPYVSAIALCAACGGGSSQSPGAGAAVVRVAAASDLKFALDEIATRAGRDGALRIEPTYGSSGNFHAQLQQRAPFDVYLSADIGYPKDLVARGIGREADLFAYGVGRLVLWAPADSPLPVEREGLRALLQARRIAIANPRHAPYGRAAVAALQSTGIEDAVRSRLVLGESVAQAAQFVQSGSADAGLIAGSLVVATAMRESGRYHVVPPDAYPAVVQGGLILPWAASREAAVRVRDLLLGEEGREVLGRFGFEAAPQVSALQPEAGR